MQIKEEYKNVSAGTNKQTNLALIFIIIALFLYCYFGTFSFFDEKFATATEAGYWRVIYHHCTCFFLFFICGLLVTRFAIKSPLTNYGLKLHKSKFIIMACIIATVIAPVIGVVSAFNPSMNTTYPLIDFSIYGEWYYILGYFASYLLYYIGWEYLFRGLGLFSLKEKNGPLTSILITTLISALIHTSIGGFGKPMVETLSAIPAGLIFGYIAYKSESIWPTVYIHFLIGLFTDIMIFVI